MWLSPTLVALHAGGTYSVYPSRLAQLSAFSGLTSEERERERMGGEEGKRERRVGEGRLFFSNRGVWIPH